VQPRREADRPPARHLHTIDTGECAARTNVTDFLGTCRDCSGGIVRLCLACILVVVLVLVVAQLQAHPKAPEQVARPLARPAPTVVGVYEPELISTTFILGGALAMGLWKLVRKFDVA
jgi:hypothetical protein